MATEAVIMAGGRGTRLDPLTRVLPKPLLPLGDRPVLSFLLERLRQCGFRRVTLAVGRDGSPFRACFGRGEGLGMTLDYLAEPEPLGTCGALRLLPRQRRPFLLLNGDVLTTLDFRTLLERHRRSGAAITLAVQQRTVALSWGSPLLEGNRVVGFREKPTESHWASLGIYALSPEAVRLIPAGVPCDVPDLVRAAVDRGLPVLAHPTDAYWIDVGTPEEFARAAAEWPRVAAALPGA
ncbi:MAG: NTP transferase domain-containing protein, partial [Clostridia bacterium]|nr:NTP transferase domain-containing protein [Clostridia bacterium]